MSDAQDLAHWLRLERTRGVGPDTARRLLSAFGLPENIFAASHAALLKVVSENVARALLAPPDDELLALIDKTSTWAAQPHNRVLSLADADYPPSLLQIADPPVLLYAKGRHELLTRPSLAIVGSRNATAQGKANAERFAETLSAGGLTVVSGLALGIDASAHEGALRSGKGSTVAVIGTGADLVYPSRHRDLAHRIAADGCILSEYPLGMPAIASNFPKRNRLISGLAQGVLVVEAAAQSGSLITARLAAEQGKEVFAIPGSIHSPLAKGCHQLIRQGAKLVESAHDILEELRLPVQHSIQKEASLCNDAASYDELLESMGYDPVGIDLLAMRCGMDAAALSAHLLNLELEGLVENLPGGIYRRIN
jgi:DNA processing protein